MPFVLFTPFFNKIDTTTTKVVTSMSNNLIAELAPVVSIGLTLTFVLFGLAIISGKIDMPVPEFLQRAFRIAVISAVAITGGIYQSHIAGMIQHTPDEFASALLGSATSGASAGTLIDKAAGQGFDRAAEAFEKAGFFKEAGVVYGFFGVLILGSTAVLTAIGGSFILLTKLMLALLAMFGPLFIILLLWQATSQFFERWLGQVLNYALLVVLFSAVFGLMMDIYGDYMKDLKFDGKQNIAYALGGGLILAVSMVVVLLKLPDLASSLAGGASASFLHELRATKNMASAAGSAGAGAARVGAGAAKLAHAGLGAADIAASKATGAAARGLYQGGRAAGAATYRGAVAAGAAAHRGGSAALQAGRRAAGSVAGGARRAASYFRGGQRKRA